MMELAARLPLRDTIAPAQQGELVVAVQRAFAEETPVYPIGGGTSLDFGLPAADEGIALQLSGLDRVIDYPARDMTITVEAGMTMTRLAETLAAEGQRLPVDVPDPDRATLGGVIATNTSGPRRYGQGTMRDYVIGISAVDGRGVLFKGGGRVVKNVAGYDFCKLLTGSLGTLGIISQVTLKVRPVPRASRLLATPVNGWNEGRQRLEALASGAARPVAIEWLIGPAWSDDPALVSAAEGTCGRLVVGLEGTVDEVDWMEQELNRHWDELGAAAWSTIVDDAAPALWRRLTDFPANPDAPLVVKANVAPSYTTSYLQRLQIIDPDCSVQAHAGSGIIVCRFSPTPPAQGYEQIFPLGLVPEATMGQGSVVVLGGRVTRELPPPAIWGKPTTAWKWMTRVKQQFDPKNLLNRGRFVYEH